MVRTRVGRLSPMNVGFCGSLRDPHLLARPVVARAFAFARDAHRAVYKDIDDEPRQQIAERGADPRRSS